MLIRNTIRFCVIRCYSDRQELSTFNFFFRGWRKQAEFARNDESRVWHQTTKLRSKKNNLFCFSFNEIKENAAWHDVKKRIQRFQIYLWNSIVMNCRKYVNNRLFSFQINYDFDTFENMSIYWVNEPASNQWNAPTFFCQRSEFCQMSIKDKCTRGNIGYCM